MTRFRVRCVLTLAVAVPCLLGAEPTAAQERLVEETVEIAIGGDVSLGNRMNGHIEALGADAVLGEPVPQIGDADLAIVNLESVVSEGGEQGVDKGQTSPLYFRGRPEMLRVLDAAGIDGVTTANNHAGDYGPEALADQRAYLDRMGVAHAGSGANIGAACDPAYLSAKGLTVAFLSADTTQPRFAATDDRPGTCYLPPGDHAMWRDVVGRRVSAARERADVVLMFVHWGANFQTSPSSSSQRLARYLVEWGADAVVGGNAHRPQGVEVVDGRPVIYDAGTLLFDFPKPHDAVLWSLAVGRHGVERATPTPLVSEPGWTRLAAGDDRVRIFDSLAQRSEALGTTTENGSVRFAPPARAAPPGAPPSVAQRTSWVPQASTDPPRDCIVEVLPKDVERLHEKLGELHLLAARVEPDALHGPAMVWVETYWSVSTALDGSYLISPRAYPSGKRLEPWGDPHEPCDWRWPVDRWQPGEIYVDRYPLRPADSVLRLGGLPAWLVGGFANPLEVRVGVERVAGERAEGSVIARVRMDPSPLLTAVLLVVPAAVLASGVILWWRRRPLQRRRSERDPSVRDP